MDILVVGGGGREHAIIRCLKQSKRAGRIYCAPGNGGIARDAELCGVASDDIDGMVRLAKEKNVGLVVVAPDDPLAAGMVDAMHAAGIRAFGPTAKAAQIEASKVFAKDLMRKYHIPTAPYAVFSDPQAAARYIETQEAFPLVLKADGLALGKGVLICETRQAAMDGLRRLMVDRAFGGAGSRIVVEGFLRGPEVSVLALTDGRTILPLASSMDHKRALDGDRGPNTGGMGTISPNPYYTKEIETRCMREIFRPTVDAMRAEGRPFKGCLYFGLMLTADGPMVIEYNARFGDPETQVVLPRLESDLLELFEAVVDERLDSMTLAWRPGAAACVVLASGGYPGAYQKGLPIEGLDADGQARGCIVYHAGTRLDHGRFYTAGGRVLGVSALGDTLGQALALAYDAAAGIRFEGMHYRRDIGRTAQGVS